MLLPCWGDVRAVLRSGGRAEGRLRARFACGARAPFRSPRWCRASTSSFAGSPGVSSATSKLAPEMVEGLRELEARGSVVYVMRYASRLDYFLFNALFLRENLRLSRFANGVRFYYYGSFLKGVRLSLDRFRGQGGPSGPLADQEQARQLVRSGESFFLFLRTARLRDLMRRKPPGRAGPVARGCSWGLGFQAVGRHRALGDFLAEGSTHGEPLPQYQLRSAHPTVGSRQGVFLPRDLSKPCGEDR